MVTEFCGFEHGVIGKELPADTTLNNLKKAELIKLLHTAQHNYETLMWFYNNAVKWNMAKLNNNGWIPCSEELPKEDGWYYVTVKYGNSTESGMNKFTKGNWSSSKGFEVIAWQHRPQPYQPKAGEK